MSPRRRLLGYYRQFEALSPEEDSRRLRARREEEKSRELARVGDLDLSRDDFHEPPDPEVVNAATFALRRAINRYPAGDAALEAVAARHGVPVGQVVLGHGAGELLQAALRELAAGAEAVLPWPSWSPLPALVARAGVRPVPVPLRDEAVDLDALAAAVTPATRAVVLCSPNDPTGTLVAPGALRAFATALPDGVTVLVDEALVELAGEDASCAGLTGELHNLLVLRSFSKGWAMAGLRGGYALGPEGSEALLAVLGPGQGVASPTLAAIAAALEDPARAARRLAARRGGIEAERARLARLLEGTRFGFEPAHAHHVWLRGGPDDTAASLTHGLGEQRVLVASGARWDDERHVRVTLRDRAATERLAAALGTLGG